MEGRHVWCKTHPTYKGLREPRAACAACWLVWLLMDHQRLAAEVMVLLNDRASGDWHF